MTRRNFVAYATCLGLCGAPARLLGRISTLSVSDCSTDEKTPNQIYYDKFGLIVQRNCDGGDTAQREGWYWFGTWVRSSNFLNQPWPISRRLSFTEVMDQLEIGQTGTFRRHPGTANDPRDFSRDQTIPIVAAMGVRNDGARLQRFYHELRRRNWMAQNGRDAMWDPVNRNLVARARNEEPNGFTDSGSLFAAVQTRILVAKSKGMDDVGDDLNLLVALLLATVRKPNAQTDKVREHFAKDLPDNYGMFLGSYRQEYGTDWDGKTSQQEMQKRIDSGIKKGGANGWKPDCPRVLGALRWYFRAESGGCLGLAELYEPIVKKWFQ